MRAIPLTGETAAVLRAWLKERRGQPDEPLFPTRQGQQLSRYTVWSASEFAIEIGVSIRQHPTGSPTSTGGSDHVRTRPWTDPGKTPHQAVPVSLAEVRDLVAAGPSGGDDRRGRSRRTRRPVHDHADPHRREGGCAGGAGRVQTRRAGPGAGLRTRAGQGRGGPAVRDGQGDGRQADVGPGKRRVGLSGRVPHRVDAATKPHPPFPWTNISLTAISL